MSKKITIELTDEEYEALTKFFAAAKQSKFQPSKALNIDDFCKEIIVMTAKGPNLDQLKNLKLEDLLGNLGDLKDALGGLGGDVNLEDILGGKQKPKKEEPKKDEVPDDQKYKS